jgi:hypothetical protein
MKSNTAYKRTHEREDGSASPDRGMEQAVLAESSQPLKPKYNYDRTLGDLIVEALVPNIRMDVKDSPEAWGTLDNNLLDITALELRAITIAMTHGDAGLDNALYSEFTPEDAARVIEAISRRLEAGAEISRRLREARWGDPRFGGGGRSAKYYGDHPKRQAAAEEEEEEASHESGTFERPQPEVAKPEEQTRFEVTPLHANQFHVSKYNRVSGLERLEYSAVCRGQDVGDLMAARTDAELRVVLDRTAARPFATPEAAE